MNREILFRGKRLDNGEWVYGYLWSSRTIGCESPCGNTDEIVVDPSTIGQYTGLTDKNGVKIFEGDICKDSLGWEFTVVWDENARFLGRSSNGRIAYVCRVPEVEIIGNIHDGKDGQHDEL